MMPDDILCACCGHRAVEHSGMEHCARRGCGCMKFLMPVEDRVRVPITEVTEPTHTNRVYTNTADGRPLVELQADGTVWLEGAKLPAAIVGKMVALEVAGLYSVTVTLQAVRLSIQPRPR